MTELNGKVPVGGVLLGGRQVTLTIQRDTYAKLSVLASANSTGQTAMLEFIVTQGVDVGFSQLMIGKLFFVLASWTQYVS